MATTPLAPMATNCEATEENASSCPSSEDWQAFRTNRGTLQVASA